MSRITKGLNSLRHSVFYRLFFEDAQNSVLFVLVLFFNFISAFFDGISFSVILLALTVLGGETSSPMHHTLFSFMNIQNLFAGSSSNTIFTFFIVIAIALQAFRSSLVYIGQFFMTNLGCKIQTKIQKIIYRQIFSFSFSCVNRYKIGDLSEYAITPINMVAPLMEAINRIIVSFLTTMALFVVMCMISFSLSLVMIPLFCLLGICQQVIVRKMMKKSKQMSEHVADYSKQLIQNLHGIRAIFTFSRQKCMQYKINTTIEHSNKTSRELLHLNNFITPINEILGIFLVGFCLIIGPFLLDASDSKVILPVLLTYITVTYRLASRVQVLIGGIGSCAVFFGPLLRLSDILSPHNKEFSPEGGSLFDSFKENIEFSDVHLQYIKDQNYSLKSISFQFSKGQTIAFVGFSGAGKSSIMDLLLRLYAPTKGCIKVDGVDLQTFEIGSWRNKLGVVSQDAFLFNESIADNICFGSDVTLDEIVRAAKIAGAHEFIERLPGGYQTIVGERGYRLSGGEKQRIAFARALVRDPEILILDEATSNLDSHSEEMIQGALNEIRKNKTIILVAHRLSTVVSADKIFVMNQGSIIESGTHAELLAKNARYAHFWKLQSRGQEEAVSESFKQKRNVSLAYDL